MSAPYPVQPIADRGLDFSDAGRALGEADPARARVRNDVNEQYQDSSSTEEIGCVGVSLNLVSVVQLFPHGFYHQTDNAIGDGICDQSFIEANRVMHARDRDGAG
jgi:hypothetical protein